MSCRPIKTLAFVFYVILNNGVFYALIIFNRCNAAFIKFVILLCTEKIIQGTGYLFHT